MTNFVNYAKQGQTIKAIMWLGGILLTAGGAAPVREKVDEKHYAFFQNRINEVEEKLIKWAAESPKKDYMGGGSILDMGKEMLCCLHKSFLVNRGEQHE